MNYIKKMLLIVSVVAFGSAVTLQADVGCCLDNCSSRMVFVVCKKDNQTISTSTILRTNSGRGTRNDDGINCKTCGHEISTHNCDSNDFPCGANLVETKTVTSGADCYNYSRIGTLSGGGSCGH